MSAKTYQAAGDEAAEMRRYPALGKAEELYALGGRMLFAAKETDEG